MPIRYRTGKKPARAGAFPHRFASFFAPAELPTPPLMFGRTNLIGEWNMYSNDVLADCTIAGAAHEHMLWAALAGKPIPRFTDETVTADYSAACGYVPGKPETDQGGDLGHVADYRKATGIIDADGVRHKIDGAVSLNSPDQAILAGFLFGSCAVGLQLPSYAMDQFDRYEPWHLEPGARNREGHYVPLMGRNVHGDLIIPTWGRIHAMTEDFLRDCMDEAAAFLVLDQLNVNTHLSQRGFDMAGLQAAFGKFGS